MKGISLHSIVPVRAEAQEGAEQNTQMLFGELCEVLEEKPRWNRIKLDLDGQEGWVDSKMICPMKSEELASYREACKHSAKVVFPMVYAVSENNGQTIPLTAGTCLPNYQNGRFEVLGVGFRIDPSMVATQIIELNQANLLQTVRFFLNVPYLWGGKNALGMDCSGFTQVIMSLFGKSLLRNASEQATQGEKISKLQDVQAGDLAFFDHEDGKISHVGIVIDAERIIHCSGRVKVEKLDEIGIFSAETGQYTHHLVQIRRIE
ncbi:MAG: C40 family peptidase [Paludibacteraceae bacterium]|nr:C40 family peptidase [Paludibacteraceae bacterium]